MCLNLPLPHLESLAHLHLSKVPQAFTLLSLLCAAQNLPPPGSPRRLPPPLSPLGPLCLNLGCSVNTISTFPGCKLHLNSQVRWFLNHSL